MRHPPPWPAAPRPPARPAGPPGPPRAPAARCTRARPPATARAPRSCRAPQPPAQGRAGTGLCRAHMRRGAAAYCPSAGPLLPALSASIHTRMHACLPASSAARTLAMKSVYTWSTSALTLASCDSLRPVSGDSIDTLAPTCAPHGTAPHGRYQDQDAARRGGAKGI